MQSIKLGWDVLVKLGGRGFNYSELKSSLKAFIFWFPIVGAWLENHIISEHPQPQ